MSLSPLFSVLSSHGLHVVVRNVVVYLESFLMALRALLFVHRLHVLDWLPTRRYVVG